MLQRILGCAGVFALAASLSAQTTAPQWSLLTFVQIKPDCRMEYEATAKEISAAYKKGGASSRVVVQTVLGDLMEYTSIVPLGKFAEMDAPSPLVKALGDAGSQRILKKSGACLNAVRREAVLEMPDITMNDPSEQDGEYAHVITWKLLPGKASEFTAFMKDDYLPMLRKAGVKNFWVSRPIFGGDLDVRYTVRPLHKVGDLDVGPLTTKALGAEGARALGMKQSMIVESTHYSIVRVRPDLSLMPAPPPAAK